ncbi:MAG: DUF4190 domain-containing protein [Clostridia bacterium]|nr:DUF4190 domain-containing protein [Clostridia bacterium]
MNQDPYTPNNENPSDNQNNNSYYNAQGPYFDPYASPMQRQSKAFSIASLVLGIVAIVCCCLSPVSLICAVLAIVFAVLHRRQVGFFEGMSIAGLVCGIIGAVLAIYLIVDSIMNPVVMDEAFWEEYYKMMDELMAEANGGTPAALRMLLGK